MNAFERKVSNLSAFDIAQIEAQYDAAMDTEHGSGEHWILIGLLNQKSFRVNSYQDALLTAGKIIAAWYRLA